MSGPAAAPTGPEPSPVSRRVGMVCLTAFAVLLARPAAAGVVRRPARGPVRGLLPERCARLRRRSRRAAAAPHDGRRPGLGLRMTQFLAGYGAAQAVPGPLFSFAAYLGTVSGPVTERLDRGDDRPGRDLPAVVPADLRRPAVLGPVARLDRLPARAHRDERGRRRDPPGGALHARLDERDHGSDRCRDRGRRAGDAAHGTRARRSWSWRSAPSRGSWSPASARRPGAR